MVNLTYVSPDSIDSKYGESIFKLLSLCDEEFIPPLSSRNNSYQSNLIGEERAEGPYSYYEELIKQHTIVALDNTSQVVAFISFRNKYNCEELNSIGSSNYATTICVRNDLRGKGMAQKLYKYLEESIPIHLKLQYLTIRTWSTNYDQIHIFNKLGFSKVSELRDHRGAGIHTVYYAKKVN
jgi:ribosomal protein S18 acetylase RimI-like enzyme